MPLAAVQAGMQEADVEQARPGVGIGPGQVLRDRLGGEPLSVDHRVTAGHDLRAGPIRAGTYARCPAASDALVMWLSASWFP